VNSLFFGVPASLPAQTPKHFQRVVLKKGKYLKAKCSNILPSLEMKAFGRLLHEATKISPNQVLVGPAFCMSDNGDNSFNLMDKESDQALRVHINKLKSKLDLNIKNIRGVGYKLEEI